MLNTRSSGILLHITSLPSREGIGDLGCEARRFADFLAESRQRFWQVLPLGPTGYGDSPYQSLSAFAGNPLLISLEELVEEGLLSREDLNAAPNFPLAIDYGRVGAFKLPQLEKAFQNFCRWSGSSQRDDFESFKHKNVHWLEDFSLFLAIKRRSDLVTWTRWESGLATRRQADLAAIRENLSSEIESIQFSQYLFFRQWTQLRAYCREHQVAIIGDVPIFVAHDSSDVWAHQELFQLDETGYPTVVAGVPPDYFSQDGQRWGNPLYRWELMEKDGFSWWRQRLRQTLDCVDLVRLDHFRGFESYWEVPASEPTARIGRWVKGPGGKLFDRLAEEFEGGPFIAENLGLITPEVEALRLQYGLAGMAILQFAFGDPEQAREFLPENYTEHLFAYTGTHDNDTTVGWWQRKGDEDDTTQSVEEAQKERQRAESILDVGDREIHWVFLEALFESRALAVLAPLQDVLGLGSEARMNLPGRAEGNWRWRYQARLLTSETVSRLRRLTERTDRA